MAYSNAVFYMDYDNGSNDVRATLTDVVFSNPSEDIVLGTYVGHGLITGAVITVSGCTKGYANSVWKITYVSDDTFTLDGASWASFNGADVTGNVVPFGGQSWADAWKDMTGGATAARIAPGDTIRIAKSPAPTSLGQSALWANYSPNTQITSPSGITITSSTNTTPIVITKNGHGFVNGMVVKIINHTTNTNANGVWIVANKTDNTFELEGSVGNGVGGATGTIYDVSAHCVVLTTPVTQTICNCEDNWTAGTNVTSAGTDAAYFKQFIKSVRIVCKSSHGEAGMVGKYGLPTSLDLSGYQQISFWIYFNYVLDAAGDLKVKLYSDADCTSEVESFDVPALTGTNRWIPITLNKGSALSATVQGIALYAGKASPNRNWYVDNFIACKNAASVDSLSLQSLISKNTTEQGSNTSAGYADEPWLCIQSIDGRIIALDMDTLTKPFSGPGYTGVPETVPLYKRETIKTVMSSSGASVNTIQDSGGGVGTEITFVGGYNTSGPDACDGETIFDGLNGHGYGIYGSSKNYLVISKISGVRLNSAINIDNGYGNIIDVPDANNCSYAGVQISGTASGITILSVRNSCRNVSFGVMATSGYIEVPLIGNVRENGTSGAYFQGSLHSVDVINCASGNVSVGVYTTGCYGVTINKITKAFKNTYGIQLGGRFITVKEANCYYNSNYGAYLTPLWDSRILKLTCTDNSSYGIYTITSRDIYIYNYSSSGNTRSIYRAREGAGPLYLVNYTIAEGTTVTLQSDPTGYDSGGKVCGMYSGGDADSHYLWTWLGTLNSQTTVRYTESGIAWLIQPNSNSTGETDKLCAPLSKIACEAGKKVTVTLKMRRSDTRLTLGMICKAGQLTTETASADLLIPVTAIANTWETITLEFTPTIKGVVEVEVYAYRNAAGGTYLGYFDDITISQVA